MSKSFRSKKICRMEFGEKASRCFSPARAREFTDGWPEKTSGRFLGSGRFLVVPPGLEPGTL